MSASEGDSRSSQKNSPRSRRARILAASKRSRTCIRRRDGSGGAGCSRRALRGGARRLALGGLQHAGAALVPALVLADAGGRRLVGVAQRRADLLDVLAVVAVPRLATL